MPQKRKERPQRLRLFVKMMKKRFQKPQKRLFKGKTIVLSLQGHKENHESRTVVKALVTFQQNKIKAEKVQKRPKGFFLFSLACFMLNSSGKL